MQREIAAEISVSASIHGLLVKIGVNLPVWVMPQYLMDRRQAKSLKGRVVDRIERDEDNIRIVFSDGYGITIKNGDKKYDDRLKVYFWTPNAELKKR